MKNILFVDVDTERTNPGPVVIGKPNPMAAPKSQEEMAEVVKMDIACLCEAVCTLIHVADQNGIRPSAESLRICIDHLQKGFGDASYLGKIVAASPNPT